MPTKKFLTGRRIGISISESSDLAEHGFGTRHLLDVLVETARYLLSCGALLAYGGDIKYSRLDSDVNFTEILFELVNMYNQDLDGPEKNIKRIYNYVSYPVYRKIDNQEKMSITQGPIQLIEISAPDNLKGNSISVLDCLTDDDHYIWARNLTLMREKMNKDIDARIILGGKTSGYRGKYPGLAEEAYLALKSNKPVFIIGAFGGCAKVIIKALKGEKPLELTEKYQKKDKSYASFYRYYSQKAEKDKTIDRIDYPMLTAFFEQCQGLNNGLTEEENEKIFTTGDILEIISLILKGLKNIRGKKE